MRGLRQTGNLLGSDTHAYGIVLLLILITLAFLLAAPDDEWARAVTVVLQVITLVATLRVSGTRRRVVTAGTLIGAAALLGAAGALVGAGELGPNPSRIIGLLLVGVAPVAIVMGLVRDARATGMVTVRTMFGVLCVYLLLGMLFAYGYALIEQFSDQGFFAETSPDRIADFLYFSFTTLTTTGYGDLTAATDLGRSLAVTEALLGQIYLVTVVAVIVGHLGRGRIRVDA